MGNDTIRTLLQSRWGEFSAYLFIERKLRQSPGNVSSIKYRYNDLCEFFTDKVFNRQNFNLFIGGLKQRGLSNSTLNNYIKVAKHIDKWLKADCLQDYTHFKRVEAPVEPLTAEEVRLMAELQRDYKATRYGHAETGQKYRTLIYFLATTGCRIEEALHLLWSDVTFGDEMTCVLFRETKNGEDRQIPLLEKVAQMVTGLPRKSERVFNTYHRDSVATELKIRATLVGITKRVYPHLFRHTFITLMRETGMDDSTVCMYTGHKDVNSMKRYDHYSMNRLKDALQAHPYARETQTLASVKSSLTKFLDRTLNPSRFVLTFQEGNGEITVKVVQADS